MPHDFESICVKVKIGVYLTSCHAEFKHYAYKTKHLEEKVRTAAETFLPICRIPMTRNTSYHKSCCNGFCTERERASGDGGGSGDKSMCVTDTRFCEVVQQVCILPVSNEDHSVVQAFRSIVRLDKSLIAVRLVHLYNSSL